MPITHQKLESLLTRIGCNFRFDAAKDRQLFEARFETKLYVSSSGSKSVSILAKILEDGALVQFLCPELYDLSACSNRGAVFEAAMQMAWSTKSLAFEYDAESKKLWVTVDLPLEDGTLTANQVERIVGTLVELIDEYHPVLKHAIDCGEIDFRRTGNASASQPAATEVENLIRKLGGLDKVKKILDKTPNDAPRTPGTGGGAA
jgi:hypothetical protein